MPDFSQITRVNDYLKLIKMIKSSRSFIIIGVISTGCPIYKIKYLLSLQYLGSVCHVSVTFTLKLCMYLSLDHIWILHIYRRQESEMYALKYSRLKPLITLTLNINIRPQINETCVWLLKHDWELRYNESRAPFQVLRKKRATFITK